MKIQTSKNMPATLQCKAQDKRTPAEKHWAISMMEKESGSLGKILPVVMCPHKVRIALQAGEEIGWAIVTIGGSTVLK